MKTTSKDKVNDARALLAGGLSIRDISARLQLSKSVVGRIRKATSVPLTPVKLGRPVKLSPADKRFCVHKVTAGKIETATAVSQSPMEELNVAATAGTVRRALREAGLGAMEKASKPMLSKANIKKRLEFAKRHQRWTLDDWRSVIWSD